MAPDPARRSPDDQGGRADPELPTCMTYDPALAILGRPDAVTGSPLWLLCTAPAVGALFLLASLRVWRFGVAHYRSTGS